MELKWSFRAFLQLWLTLLPLFFKSFSHDLSLCSLFQLSPSIRELSLPFFSGLFLILVGPVKQKPTGPEGETLRHVILPLTDNTNSRIRIIMFDWALVGETLLHTLIIFRSIYIYCCCQTNPTSAFGSVERNACFLREFSHVYLKLYNGTVTGFMTPQSLKLAEESKSKKA